MCTSNAVSDKQLYPTFARTIFGDNSLGPSVLAIMEYFKWNLVGIISEDDEGWGLRGNFIASFLKSQGKTVALHEKVKYNWVYNAEENGAHYQEVLQRMKTEARSKQFTLRMM